MSGEPYLGFPELAPPLLLNAGEVLIVKESRRAECAIHLPQDCPHVKLACLSNQQRAQIEFGVLPIEAGEAFEELRRYQQSRVGVPKRIPDQQARALRVGRWHEVEFQSEPG